MSIKIVPDVGAPRPMVFRRAGSTVARQPPPMTVSSIWRSMSPVDRVELIQAGVPFIVEIGRWLIKGLARMVAQELNRG